VKTRSGFPALALLGLARFKKKLNGPGHESSGQIFPVVKKVRFLPFPLKARKSKKNFSLRHFRPFPGL
jgi:hypothetical protein